MLPLLILGGSYLATAAASRTAAKVALGTTLLEGAKAGAENRVLKEAAHMGLNPSRPGRLVRATIPDQGLPPEYRFIAGEYLLTDEERAVFTQIMRGFNGGEMPDLDALETLRRYKEMSKARMNSKLLK